MDSSLRETLAIALHEALSYLEKLDRSPVEATVDLSDLRRRLGKPLAREGIPPERVIAELVSDVEGGILGSAGDINIGAYDPFELLIPIAKRYGARVHIDGAFSLFAAASPRYWRLVKGVEAADSWATDGHKWSN